MKVYTQKIDQSNIFTKLFWEMFIPGTLTHLDENKNHKKGNKGWPKLIQEDSRLHEGYNVYLFSLLELLLLIIIT